MIRKPKNAYICICVYIYIYIYIRVSYFINIASLLHVSATLVAILRGVHYKEYITKLFETTHKYTVVSCIIFGFQYILKYKIQITFCD